MKKPLRRDAEKIFRAAIAAADPTRAVLAHLHLDEQGILTAVRRRYDLARFEHVFVIGAGKAGASMAVAVEKLLGKKITDGLINVKEGHIAKLRYIELNQATHPIPGEIGVSGSRRILKIAQDAGKRDLVICLISGGASALLPLPTQGITLEDKQIVTGQLLGCGATIHEINAVRKHLSAIKGGRLAQAVHPAALLTLVLSDVIGDDLSVIGSGPTVADPSTFADALRILEKFDLLKKTPPRVLQVLRSAQQESPKPGDVVFKKSQTIIVGSNRLAIAAAAKTASQLGYRPLLLSTTIEGETREVAAMHVEIAREVRASGQPVGAPACLLSGGETTVTLRGEGKGGRNQEFSLAAVSRLASVPDALVLSAGTDGTDGPTIAAGAFASSGTLARATALGLDPNDYLLRNDSFSFFEKLGDLLVTGPTNTNVMDVRIILLG